jgi:DNA-binding IclR family transcriptional regulator
MQLVEFTTVTTSKWPQGFAAAELAASRPAGLEAVHQRLEALVQTGLLVHDPARRRYGLLFWVPFAEGG